MTTPSRLDYQLSLCGYHALPELILFTVVSFHRAIKLEQDWSTAAISWLARLNLHFTLLTIFKIVYAVLLGRRIILHSVAAFPLLQDTMSQASVISMANTQISLSF